MTVIAPHILASDRVHVNCTDHRWFGIDGAAVCVTEASIDIASNKVCASSAMPLVSSLLQSGRREFQGGKYGTQGVFPIALHAVAHVSTCARSRALGETEHAGNSYLPCYPPRVG
jgi:hypothetical protein